MKKDNVQLKKNSQPRINSSSATVKEKQKKRVISLRYNNRNSPNEAERKRKAE